MGESPDVEALRTLGKGARPSYGKFLEHVAQQYSRKHEKDAYLVWLVAQHILRAGDKGDFDEALENMEAPELESEVLEEAQQARTAHGTP